MSLPDFPLAFWPVAAFAILVTGIAKGGFAAGSGGLAVPLMAIFIAPAEAAGIMLPILCAMDLFGLHAYRGRASAVHLRALLPGAIVGIVLGGIAFGMLSADAVRLLVGLIAIAFALNRWFGITERIAARLERETRPPGRVAGAFWGAVSGVTSTLAHAGGPPFAVYMIPQPVDRTTLVATSVVFFAVVNYVKLVPYHLLGQLNLGNLTVALLFAPLAPIGIWLGVWLHTRLSERWYYGITYALLFVAGVKLVWDGLAP